MRNRIFGRNTLRVILTLLMSTKDGYNSLISCSSKHAVPTKAKVLSSSVNSSCPRNLNNQAKRSIYTCRCTDGIFCEGYFHIFFLYSLTHQQETYKATIPFLGISIAAVWL